MLFARGHWTVVGHPMAIYIPLALTHILSLTNVYPKVVWKSVRVFLARHKLRVEIYEVAFRLLGRFNVG